MNSTKTRRLDLRLTEEQDALIRRAAEQDARSISDFVLSAATLEAQRRLADQRFFMLNEEDHARFEEILQAPPTDDPKLRKLFDRPSPFGTHIDLSTPKISENRCTHQSCKSLVPLSGKMTDHASNRGTPRSTTGSTDSHGRTTRPVARASSSLRRGRKR